MKPWVAARYEEKGKIMKTDIFVELLSQTLSQEEMSSDIATAFQMFRDFEAKFSRFREESELSVFNAGEGGKISEELFLLLQKCAFFHQETQGIFDPSILPVLEKVGYSGSTLPKTEKLSHVFSELIFDKENQTVTKPKDVFIDFGGIGKGYIVDQVACFLSKKYTNGIVDAGGDIMTFGGDKMQGLDAFAIDIENPFDPGQTLSMVLLSEMAIATSGLSRRHWIHEGKKEHHIIDPTTEESVHSGLMQVSVILPNATMADVLAKTLLILGLDQGLSFAEERKIPALFVSENKTITRNSFFEHYEWKA
ncbi:MAG: FAD:protein FMN transferase [Candidatus Moranbacteria bacterium]|nr:FAD:protein FMN transferase [Candidatus Moranbacteria bacterium]